METTMAEERPEVKSNFFKRRSGMLNIQKSINMLDEAVGVTPGRGGRINRSNFVKRSTYVSSPRGSYDVPHSFTPISRKSVAESFMDSPTMTMTHPISLSMLDNMTGIPDDVTTTNLTLQLEDDPGLLGSVSLFREFEQCRKRNTTQNIVLDLLLDYENVCLNQVTILKKINVRSRKNMDRFEKTFSTLRLLELEKMTWQLVRSLYCDRLAHTEAELMDDKPLFVSSQSEQNVVKSLFQKDTDIRQIQLVVDWLEMSVKENCDTVFDNVKFYSDQAVGCENTLHQLQNKSRGIPLSTDRPLVEELDPDAPIRTNRILDDLDTEDESLLLHFLYCCIRSGQMEKAQDICQSSGQSWRAATLEGWRLYHDPNYDGVGDYGQIQAVQGSPYRDVWKNVCWNLAKEPKMNQYEKAMYSVLSGNLQGVLPVCRSWGDHLWAYLKVMVDVRVEQEVRFYSTAGRPLQDLPPDYWNALMEPRQIFQEIEASNSDSLKAESQSWFPVIQKYIILGDVDSLIERMHNWIKTEKTKLPSHFLRFMAHLVLFFRTIGLSSKEELCTTILETYVEDLIKNKHKTLVAHYVAQLPSDSQVVWYAKFLEEIEDQEDRILCLNLAEESSLNITLITKTVVENIRHRDCGKMVGPLDMAVETMVSKEDRQKIEAIDWLVFDPTQRSEALKQANALMRTFIAVKKHVAARAVFEKLPSNSVDVIYKTCLSKMHTVSLSSSDDNAIREYLCLKAYLDAIDSFNDWFSLFNHGKPNQPDLTSGASFTDRVAYEHRMKQYQTEVDRWQYSLRLQTKTTKDHIYNVLLFVNGGWMVDQLEEAPIDESRQRQMSLLRKLHIPALSLNLQYVLHASELHAECLQLADYVASEQHQLYKEFTKDDLRKFMVQIRASSLCLLDQNKDPLGYQLV